MPKIFISYRRDDSGDVADIIYLQMKQYFDDVFLDVDGIPLGIDFREYIYNQIEAFDVVLVIIGTKWESIMQERADEANDFVRIEIENAFELGKLVIPVLVMGAEMPRFTYLPTSIEKLQWLQSTRIRRLPDLTNDCAKLAEGIKAYKPPTPKSAPSQNVSVGAASAPRLQPTSATYTPPDVSSILPAPFAWCEVPAGKFIYGEGETQQSLELPTFYIAKYPITYAQFQVFLDAKDGFYNPQWWEGLAADADHERQPGVQQWKIANHPRENVSWYDAMAFCRWLSSHVSVVASHDSPLSYDPMNPFSWAVRLPTEQEWEKAARGTDGRVYPWGDEFDENRCNGAESGFRQTTPIDRYPNGVSPYGAWDLSGNVWEWCLTEWNSGENRLLNNKKRRVVRGGSWLSFGLSTYSAIRSYDYPNSRYDNFGFRVVFSEPILS